jgi:4-hydroxy-2,2'-bipyrrole-5-carbaldehyde O-methyltransferase
MGKLEGERRKLLDAYYAGAIDPAVLRAEQHRIGDELRTAEQRLTTVDATVEQWREVLETAMRFAANCGQAYRRASHKTRRLFNQAVFDRIRGLRPQAGQRQLSAAVRPALQHEQVRIRSCGSPNLPQCEPDGARRRTDDPTGQAPRQDPSGRVLYLHPGGWGVCSPRDDALGQAPARGGTAARCVRLRYLLSVARTHGVLARLRLRRDLRSFVRLHFLVSAAESGVLQALRTSRSPAEMCARQGIRRPDLLAGFLDVGVSLGELARDGERYRLRGRASRAIVGDDGDPLLASAQELVDYHAGVYRDLPSCLLGGPQKDYLTGRGELVARSSRLVEPSIREVVRELVEGAKQVRILDIGCGSGVYLRHAAEANPEARGIGVDVTPEVVRHAQANLAGWCIDDRFTVLVADARDLPAEAAGPFDVIMLLNNIYYFDVGERPALFRDLGSRLASGGELVVVSMMRGRTLTALHLSLVLASTAGYTPLPDQAELIQQLRDSGLAHVRSISLLPGEPLRALVGRT